MEVARGYDSLVYDLSAEGQYLPLTGLYNGTINYPEHGSFHQVTYVGQNLGHNEAINSMMGVIGASLCGIDKANQDGNNWALMLEEFFNRNNGQNVYLNNAGSKTGNDWWYETIPNALFYQLYSLYPNEGDFADQFLTVADRWLEAVYGMGGKNGPWTLPYMNYRSYNLDTKEPRTDGVPEPGASGTLAWIFYMAYNQTGAEKYRIGAELCMEYFAGLNENPVYELQFLYGTVLAARMNGELETNYDLEKIMNWNFNVGPLRIWAHTTGWGVTVGNWNGIDASGLRGAISVPENTTFGDYAFIMNTFQQAGILTPLVRYDDRYARAMGRYLLNMANSARLFYSKYLPDENQDGEEWSQQYDPNSYIAYEALRRYQDGKSPFATGDAVKGSWAPTNLSLYSSSPVGYLGGILDTSNISGVLKFDLLKTDFFHEEAYPSFLIYNPHNTSENIILDAGQSAVDIYDAVSNSLVKQNVSNSTSILIEADQAVVLVFIPAGSAITQDGNTMVTNGIIIDYVPETSVPRPLRLKALAAEDSLITTAKESVYIYCTADYAQAEEITYFWTQQNIPLSNGTNTLNWTSPKTEGTYWITCTISNGQGLEITDSVQIRIVEFINTLPVIEYITIDPSRVNPGDTTHIFCKANDPDGEEISYAWYAIEGSFTGDNAAHNTWTAPSTPGEYFVFCDITDKHGGTIFDSLLIRVVDQSANIEGNLIAHYPFNYDVNDYSGNENHGTKYNLTYIEVRDAAYEFNGFNSYVEVPSSDILNCNNAITVCFWMKPIQMYDRETYPISHGLWHERWKVSVTDNRIRWTVRTNENGSITISDLDSRTQIYKDTLYQITATYDGTYTDLYINAVFEDFLHQGGQIENSGTALTIGQASPTATANNFKGVLDEFRIYDYALTHEEIKAAYARDLLVYKEELTLPSLLFEIYPNPFTQETRISYKLVVDSNVKVEIYDILSRKVKTIFAGRQSPGQHMHRWDGTGDNGAGLEKGIYFCTLFTDHGISSTTIIYN